MKSIGKTVPEFYGNFISTRRKKINNKKRTGLFQRVRMKYIGFNLDINLHFRFGDSDNRE